MWPVIPKKVNATKRRLASFSVPKLHTAHARAPSLTSGLLPPGRPLSLLSSSQGFGAFSSHFEGRGFLVHIYSMNSPFRGPPGHREFVSPSQFPSPSCEGLSPPLAASLLASLEGRAAILSAGQMASTMPQVLGHLQHDNLSHSGDITKVHVSKEFSICGSRETYGQTCQNAKP